MPVIVPSLESRLALRGKDANHLGTIWNHELSGSGRGLHGTSEDQQYSDCGAVHDLPGKIHHLQYRVLKAHWDPGDLRAMESRALTFAPLDVLRLQAAGTGKPVPATALAAAN